MLVTRIAIKNIRSYSDGEEASIDLPEGIVLLEGDIGSGKSSLLYALEFALFGFGDTKGSHLLSEGKSSGHVSVTLNIGGSLYRIERHLKERGGEVVHDACYFIDKDGRNRLSPSDLKEKVVSLLGFNEPTHPKAESLVYRYAVFTPQERMKDILTQNSEERLHVIRRVLGAQAYQAASESSLIVERKLNRQAYGLRKSGEDLPSKQTDLQAKSQKLAELEGRIPGLEAEAARAVEAVKSAESKWAELEEERRRLSEVAGRIPVLRRDVRDAEKAISDDETQLGESQARLGEDVLPRIEAFSRLAVPAETVKSLKDAKESLREKSSRSRALSVSATADLAKARDLLSRGVCPYCGQLISQDVTNRSMHLESEVTRLGSETAGIDSEIASVEKNLETAENWEVAKADAERASLEKHDIEQGLLRLREHLEEGRSKLARAKAELAEADANAAAAKEVSARIDDVHLELDTKKELERAAATRLSTAVAEKDGLFSRVSELKKEVKAKEADLAHAGKLTSHERWLSDFFKPSVEEIERQTLTHAASSFNGHFQRFFSALVEDPDIVVRVREDFSPVFEREGFEQEFDSLSGGERTSIALAYRFALTSVIGEDFASSPELVILDEPTDGFSKEQVFRLRGLLQELQSRQVIIVSHERELESMVDHIFRVEKTNGASRIIEV